MERKRKKSLVAVDFFCCSGGVTCGFKMAGIKVLAGVDIEIKYKETYEKNNKGSKFIHADIAKLQPKDLEKKLRIKRKMDNMIFVGCSPCQYYTTIQTDKSKSAKGKLLLEEFQRFVEHFLPGHIFIENVPGLDKSAESPLSKFKEFLLKNRYQFVDEVVNAADYEVPQNRKRYILIASRVNKKMAFLQPHKKRQITVRETIESMKAIPAGYRDDSKELHWSANITEINIKRLQQTPHDGGTRLAWSGNPELQLSCYNGKNKTFSDVYGRLFWDLPAPTITTKFYSISNGRYGHPEQDRALSLREGALLQSFPKSYEFISDSYIAIARMIGNAVPPLLAKEVADTIKKSYKNAAIQN